MQRYARGARPVPPERLPLARAYAQFVLRVVAVQRLMALPLVLLLAGVAVLAPPTSGRLVLAGAGLLLALGLLAVHARQLRLTRAWLAGPGDRPGAGSPTAPGRRA